MSERERDEGEELDAPTYVCALSGKAASDEELVDDAADTDALDEMPIGWIRITVERRGVAPEWVEFQTRREKLVAMQLSQLPTDATDEQRAEAEADIRFALGAQLSYAESRLARYITLEDTVYVKNPDGDPQVAEAWAEVAKTLPLDQATLSGQE